MSADRIKGGMSMRNIALTVLGFVIILCPLALWVAWTDMIFYGIRRDLLRHLSDRQHALAE
jgi:hypothetical protein